LLAKIKAAAIDQVVFVDKAASRSTVPQCGRESFPGAF